ncbi:diaminohydroxyphosphoribosylaminopyrimidine deaminase/5-amino-6-(5-phosphoribosylamino)uracil reductase [Catalinimonas alkaloidigena]|uniref:bifunctional diaminohydroxyphosphoribosylaminopyrimidine deaminase/5-amino-6-(5-phosphoribosylamino)uracil reductase n=1 Tax=Catalinimonas alkaloidigena TaxID=1075417 RepID=UPI00240565FB|nr:bifunctional diaminohydroxyphosphoribosylaminopyrimidine deaminase/5-amino-6-(5-phosphoribosylamino)uracil reductase [Catalinimonas alkaloidigena]MDF9800577.1 diaminohydroxyphosphoribosylaminopyrimidine deaminase/5-amino-6-(5-phosphoribosylamino)uracil reductase [Catalinimonas alkaloidigena]
MPHKIDLLNRTLQLALYGLGRVSPKPLLGWVLTSAQSKIIAEGWLPHKPLLSTLSSLGIAHSTINQHSLYINSLYAVGPGLIKTLPKLGISHIYSAGPIHHSIQQQLPSIIWHDNFLPKKEVFLNRRYLNFYSNRRPYIILKWAETKDGFIARENYDSKWISNVLSRRLVHKWRSEEDAIMVATNTAHYDNPKLNVRMWSGRNPVRIVIDKELKLDKKLRLFDDAQPTLCYNLHIDQAQNELRWIQIAEPKNQLDFFSRLLKDLWQRNIQSLIVEGGSRLLHFLIQHNLWDEARVFTSPQSFCKGIPAPVIESQSPDETHFIGNDSLKIYRNIKS